MASVRAAAMAISMMLLQHKPAEGSNLGRRTLRRCAQQPRLQKKNGIDLRRRLFLQGVTIGPSSIAFQQLQSKAKPPPPPHPSSAELAGAFNEWEDTVPFDNEDFRRLDESNDKLFYDQPKLVEHIDKAGVLALSRFHETQLSRLSFDLGRSSVEELDVLDLCSSWVSHLGAARPRQVVGLGINSEELNANPVLTRRIEADLNANPKLDVPDSSFDAVLCQLSIDYLVKPIDVTSEAFRVLRPGGIFVVTFSNRLFFEKAVAVWTGKSDLDHIETVGAFMHYSNAPIKSIHAFDLIPNVIKTGGDPLYAVIGTKGR
uniref:Methyltransferase type 11 domain-containing protein n=1 Tax=Lotharella oceanica TaxID=641309 RepID=A0A7S2XEX4_9EUKA|mmetsp:Transcript_34979/g.64769  ORF Transcript_34979/g.64769 Transcript_34979/m.64769 type:complete len:316 (+) Transcript_34979:32-979(+)